jgi:hypothetical protein
MYLKNLKWKICIYYELFLFKSQFNFTNLLSISYLIVENPKSVPTELRVRDQS